MARGTFKIDRLHKHLKAFVFSFSGIVRKVDSDEEKSDPVPLTYYLDDKDIPIYSEDIKDASYSELVKILHDPPRENIATRPPVKCQENCVFIVDTQAPSMRNSDDWKADDLGVFKNAGTHPVGYFTLEAQKAILQSKTKPEKCHRNTVVLKRTYWKHSVCPDFQRRAFELSYFDGKEFRKGRFILLQYLFSGKPHAVVAKPHGKSKTEKEFHRSKPGMLDSIKCKVQTNSAPAVVYDEVFEEAGGLVNVRSLSSLPRNRKQVENAKYKGKEPRSQEELYDLTLKSKEEEDAGKPYIRRLQIAPSPACVVASDRQLTDIKRFCANTTDNVSVLSIDTTFNIGDFYLTPTTYRHLLLEDKRTENPPLLMGPTLIHTRKDTETFSYFGSSLKGLQPELKNIRFMGSYREDAVEKGMSIHLPLATWLACKRHVEDDCRRKLRSLGMLPNQCSPFLLDIFGSDTAKEKGLIDAENCDDFDAKLLSLEETWNKREKTERGLTDESDAEFHQYFLSFVAQDMKRKMISPVRRRAGLSENFFFNNAAESKHKRIKDRKKQLYGERKLTWTETVDLIKGISEEEERNVERAIVGEGPFRVRRKFASKLAVPFHTYIQKSYAEKQKLNQKVHSASLEDFTISQLAKENPKKQKGKNLTECAYINIPKSVGRKPGESERRGDRSGNGVQRCTENYQERVPTAPKP